LSVLWVPRVALAAADDIETNLCTEQLLLGDLQASPSWNGWGNGPANTRFQPKAQGKLTGSELPRLELKWAFGYANVTAERPQPTVVGGRLFAPSENGHLYALNPHTGCRYWTYKAQAAIPTAVVVGHYRDASGTQGLALYFGDREANAYAVDAQTGREIWVRKVDTQPGAAITGSLAFDGTRVFVPVQGNPPQPALASASTPFRGSVVALDASIGTLIWKTYTVRESAPPTAGHDGAPACGPSGGGVSSVPTIDSKRRLVYVATGKGCSAPASATPGQATTGAVLALDINTGALKWTRQLLTPDDDLSAPPVLTQVDERDLLVLPQQSGLAWALDPAREGAALWQYRFGQGSDSGVQSGIALDHEHVYVGVADFPTLSAGGLRAVSLANGELVWRKPPAAKLCGFSLACTAGQGGPPTAIPGAVLNGSMDGGLRAYSSNEGSILWTFDTNRDFDTVNGVRARGGAMDSAGPIVVDGMVYATSGNALLAFGLPLEPQLKKR
jgi:polyvinyl alcohol dehydrogenase (cytochrome)